jgi:mevalonate kinase
LPIELKSTYPSKILLAGEYTVLLKSDALAIPFLYFSGGWRAGIRSDYPFDFDEWIGHLSKLSEYDINLDVDRMRRDFENDIRFVSNIPQGGGLGSSGGITAAFYDRYVYSAISIQGHLDEMRQILSYMEAYFHGESSGVDPIVSLTEQSYAVLNGIGSLHDIRVPKSISLHLILTTAERQTAPLITFFKESMEKPKFSKRIQEEQIPAVHSFVDAWLDGRVSEVEQAFTTISQIEWDLYKPMITKEIKPLWKESLKSEDFSIKLCGAGGGGAYLAYGTLPEDIAFKTLKIS